ncbi:MAG: hypothetical protein O7B99_10455 [Planctomycetota bacterium]|nr:hypothetical protein [Planctomycetota bacterium]
MRDRDGMRLQTGGRALWVVVLALLGLHAPPALAELAQVDGWDSGQVAVFQGGFVAGETAAIRLTPAGPCPCQVDEVRFLFGGGAGTHDVTIRIYDDTALTNVPGAELHSETVSLTGTNEFMQSVDLRASAVMVTGAFRVGLEFTHAGYPSVARDSDGSIDFSANFIDAQGFGWVPSWLLGLTGDWIIRAVVDGGPVGPGTLLANDGWIDGQVAAFQAGFVAGETAASRLVPPGPCPCRLDAVRFLFGGASGTHDVILRIWDDSAGTDAPGPELYNTTLQLTGSDDFLQEVPIGGVGLMIDGPVRVGLEFTHAGLPSVARDDDGILPDRNFIDASGTGWAESSTFGLLGDWIIRAVVDAAPVQGEALLANDGWVSGEVAAFQAGFVAGETAAVRLIPNGPCPCPITRVRFLFGGGVGTHDVTLRIWDDAALTDAPGTELYSTTLQLTGSDEIMQEVDIGVAGVEVDGPFRVGLEFTHASVPSVARDDDGISADRNFIDASGSGWAEASTLGVTGDWIIRAVEGGGAAGELLFNDGWVNGQGVAFQAGFAANEIAAVRFVPSDPCPCTLDQIRLLFGGAATTESVILRVWDDSALSDAPGALLYSNTIQLTGVDDYMQELDLTVAGITVSGAFRVGLEFQHAGLPSVARDADGITADRNFIEASGIGWVESSTLGVTGDWILRAVVNSVPGTLLASDSFVSSAPATFSSSFVATETAAVRFAPSGACPCPIQDVRFLFGGEPNTKVVTLRIWDDAALTDDPGALLYSGQHALTPNDQALRVIDLSAEGLTVTGPYRVGIEFQHAAAPSVGLDADGLTPASNFVDRSGTGWEESTASDDFILRTTYLPEPGSTLMLVTGCAFLLAMGRRRARGA